MAVADVSDLAYLVDPLALGQLQARADAVKPPAVIAIQGSQPVTFPSLGPAVIPGLHFWNTSSEAPQANPAAFAAITSYNSHQKAVSNDQAYLNADQSNYATALKTSTATSVSASNYDSLTTNTLSLQSQVSRDQGYLVADYARLTNNNAISPSIDNNLAAVSGHTYPAYSPVTVFTAQVAYEASGTVDKNHQLSNVHVSTHG